MNVIERAIAAISPSWAARRAWSRLNLNRLYDAAQVDARHSRVKNGRLSPDSIMEQTRDEVTIWARHLDENLDLVTGLLTSLSNIAARCTFEPQLRRRGPDAELHDEKNEELQELFEEWREEADWNGALHWPDFGHNIARAWLRDGEVFLNHILGAPTESGIPYQIEALESDFLPFDFSQNSPTIIHGVEKDGAGKPMAYYFWREHPNNSTVPMARLGSDFLRDTVRVPAAQVSHIKLARRLNQTRGISVLHPCIHRLDDINHYEQSERIKARVNSNVCAAITRQPGFSAVSVDSDTGERPFEMNAGQIYDLNAGESVEMIGNVSPNPEMMGFRAMMLRAVSAATGLKYSTLSRDYTEGSYSSQRQELVEAKAAEDAYRDSFAAQGYRQIWRNFVTAAVLSGRFSLQGVSLRSQFEVEISGVIVPWIDLQKEVAADKEATDAVFKSHSQTIRERGGVPRKVFAEALSDAEKLNEIEKLRQEVLPTPTFTQGTVEATDPDVQPEDTNAQAPTQAQPAA